MISSITLLSNECFFFFFCKFKEGILTQSFIMPYALHFNYYFIFFCIDYPSLVWFFFRFVYLSFVLPTYPHFAYLYFFLFILCFRLLFFVFSLPLALSLYSLLLYPFIHLLVILCYSDYSFAVIFLCFVYLSFVLSILSLVCLSFVLSIYH